MGSDMAIWDWHRDGAGTLSRDGRATRQRFRHCREFLGGFGGALPHPRLAGTDSPYLLSAPRGRAFVEDS